MNYISQIIKSNRNKKRFLVINILGLSICFSAALLILMFITFELSYDRFHDEERVYREMYSETPVYIFLSDLKEFFKLIYSADAEVGNMSGFMETIMAKGPLHRIYFFGCLKVEDAISLMSYKAYQSYISYKKGIHLGGNLSTQKIFNFQNIPYAELSKAMKKGFAYAADEEDETIGIQIVVPLARRENI